MERTRRERKRAASQRVPTIVDTRQEGSQKPIKLVLKVPPATKRPRPTSFLVDCFQLETGDEVLEHLLQINESHLPPLVDEIEKSVNLLRDFCQKYESSVPICSVVLRLLSQLVTRANILPQYVQEFALSLVQHDSVEVKVQALKTLQQILEHFSNEVKFGHKVSHIAQKEICNIHHAVRVEGLKLIGQLSHVTGDSETSLVVLEEYCNDSDPRVRTAALQSLFLMHKKGTKLPLTVYHKASEALSDDSEDARLSGLRIVWALGMEYAESTIPLKQDSSVEIYLRDDAFIKICDMVNDITVGVRAVAAGLLGDFQDVSPKFLDQTLDKKLMSHLKVVKSEHERQRELHAAGGSVDWDSGKRWGTGMPRLELDPNEISLMSAGACGAFVHGLEDEFMEVRSAAVESMCRLSTKSASFAAQSIDYIVDMFNDEIQAVRLIAINSLRRITANVKLREDQLETVLSVLEESSSEIREALHGVLSSCRLTSTGGLNSTIHALLGNLKKYPGDRQSIWRCLQQLGGNHSSLVSTLVPELLSTHPFFMGKEPDVDDPAYICILILVFNAAVRCPTVPPQFPSHVFRHYTYLRDTLPELIPWIKIGMPGAIKLTSTSQRGGQSGVRAFLCQVLSRAQSASSLLACRGAQGVWQTCISDLRRVAELDPLLASSVQCAAIFLQCQLLMERVNEVLSRDVILSSEGPGQPGLSHTVNNIRELLLLSYRLEHTFSPLPPDLQLKARLVRGAAHAALLLLAIQLDWDTEHSNQFSEVKSCFQERLKGIKSFCESHQLPMPSVLAPLMGLNLVTIATETLTQSLQPLVTDRFCASLSLSELGPVRQCRVALHEPQECGRDEFTKFVASLALAVHVDASLVGVTEGGRIAVQATFPDGRKLVFSPKSSDFRQLGPHEAKLDTSIIISHGVWTDPCQVELCVVKRYPTDVREDSCFQLPALRKVMRSRDPTHKAMPTLPHSTSHLAVVHSHSEDSLEHDRSVLVVSDVVRVNIHPQESSSKSFNVFQ